MSVENPTTNPNAIDAGLDAVNDMATVEIPGIHALCPELLPKEAFVCTSLIEHACYEEPKAKNILMA